MALRTLVPRPDSPVAEFEDIVIQDGTSLSLKDGLRHVFPGRFKTVDPAAVELHATYSGFEDQVTTVVLTPDKEAERHHLPEPSELKNMLLLADRGYPALPYFKALDPCGASFVMRLTRSWRPYVIVVHHRQGLEVLPKPVPLDTLLAQKPNQAFDLDATPGQR